MSSAPAVPAGGARAAEGPPPAEAKRAAGERAAALVESGMLVGLGTGSTAAIAIEAIGRALREGRLRDVRGVPTSRRTRALAEACGIPVVEEGDAPETDLTIDGADEVDPRLDLIKGGGGALLREKIVASRSRRNVVVVDGSTLVQRLGARVAVPVEIVRFGWHGHVPALERAGAAVTLRRLGEDPYVTAEGHWILDCRFAEGVADPAALDDELRARPGVVETGFFLGLADALVVGAPEGSRIVERVPPRRGRAP